MKKFLSLSILSICFLTASSQSLPCGNGRYIKREFPSATVTPGILFGNNTTFMGASKNLFMDVFEPTGDVSVVRPLIIFAFGGGFLTGDRTQLARLCDSVAGKGYVTAAIDYRLYDSPLGVNGLVFNPNDAIDAMAKAVSDFKAAIRYFKRDAATVNTYRIDTNSIIVGGISSGSIAALHVGYISSLDETVPPVSTILTANGGLEGNTDLPGSPLIGTYSYAGIKGVWNMSGALFDSGYIKQGDPALFGIHGTADPVVPYGYGRFFTFGGLACGSSTLNNQALKVGVPTSFISVAGGDHTTFYGDTATVVNIDTTASKFFAGVLCPTVLSVSGASLNASAAAGYVQLKWQTFSEHASKGFVIEKQSSSGWITLGQVASKSVNGSSSFALDYFFNDVQPTVGDNFYRLKIVSLAGEITYSKIVRLLWNGLSSKMFVIYPNPADATLYYRTTLAANGINTLKIYSADMRLLQSSRLTSAQHVSIANLPAGLYLGIISDVRNRQLASSWFIKK